MHHMTSTELSVVENIVAQTKSKLTIATLRLVNVEVKSDKFESKVLVSSFRHVFHCIN